jgi:hypothetical protein
VRERGGGGQEMGERRVREGSVVSVGEGTVASGRGGEGGEGGEGLASTQVLIFCVPLSLSLCLPTLL